MRALLVVLALSEGAALGCPQPFLGDLPLTKDGTTILQGGGVVMHTVQGAGNRGEFDIQSGGRLVVGDQNVDVRVDYLAPGLTVIVPKPQKGRAIELRGPRDKRILQLVQGDLAPKHLAPKLARVTASLTAAQWKKRDVRRGPYGASGSYTVELAEAPPADVLALVLYTGSGDNVQGIAYTVPQPDTTQYAFGFGGKGCGAPVAGELAQGMKVHAAWIDESGRVSILSKDLIVGAQLPTR